ncbi:hypothetical protein IQ07DRAFT_638380 [Pyrenochaeta sp. DS3sAY3a]|nr:hypothetical protein IQ07DRAFT_638380 [Pyrenochaeta sp. DS3sAY3a]
MTAPSATKYHLLPTVWIVTPESPQPSGLDKTTETVSIAVSTAIILLVLFVATWIFIKSGKSSSTYGLFQEFCAFDSTPLQMASRDFQVVPNIAVRPVQIQVQPASPKTSIFSDHRSILATHGLSTQNFESRLGHSDGHYDMSVQSLQAPAPTFRSNRNTNEFTAVRGSYLFDMEEGSTAGTQAVYDKYGWTDSQTTLYSPY